MKVGRPKKDEKDLKKYRITVKCTESEKEEIREAAKEAGMSISEWMMTASRELKKIYDMVDDINYKKKIKNEKREE